MENISKYLNLGNQNEEESENGSLSEDIFLSD
jgi:hypothetical protein